MLIPRYHQGSHCMTCTVSHCQDIGIYKYSCMPWVFPATKCSLPSKSWSPQKRSKRLTLPSTAPSTYHSWLPGAHPVFNLPVLLGSQASHVKVQHLTGMSLWTSAHIRFLRPSGRGSEPLLHHHSWRQWMLMFLNHLPIAAECFKSSMKWDLANTRISFPLRRIGPETRLYCSYVMLCWTSDNTSDPLE